jgi:hypothetical protein
MAEFESVTRQIEKEIANDLTECVRYGSTAYA